MMIQYIEGENKYKFVRTKKFATSIGGSMRQIEYDMFIKLDNRVHALEKKVKAMIEAKIAAKPEKPKEKAPARGRKRK